VIAVSAAIPLVGAGCYGLAGFAGDYSALPEGGTGDDGQAESTAEPDAGGSDAGWDGSSDVVPPIPPSCAAGGPGQTTCGPSGDASCCESIAVEGGTFVRGYDPSDSGSSAPMASATVSDFRLDKYEVTVGRFRAFVAAAVGDGGAGWTPPPGSGKHAYLDGGGLIAQGVDSGLYEPGWSASWTPMLPSSLDEWTNALRCDSGNPLLQTWTSAPTAASETLPITCLTWYAAYAFCIWDDGFLPSDAEWGYAAAGGGDSRGQRAYPWSDPPASLSIDPSRADYDNRACIGQPDPLGSCFLQPGTIPGGDGRWGHSDLAGNAAEWCLDGYVASPIAPCVDCVYLGLDALRLIRGGSAVRQAGYLRNIVRLFDAPKPYTYPEVGARCARPR
jgi:formylglycine-generating enzyme required for sulfatase activity